MKYVKLIGLAAIAALALAAAGASTASADVTCKEAPNAAGECKTLKENSNSNNWLSGTEFTVTSPSSNPAKITVIGGAVSYITCHLTMKWKDTDDGSKTPGVGISADVTDMEWTNCVASNGSTCTATTSTGYAALQTTTDDLGDGTLKVSGTGIKTKVTCLSVFNCEYELTSSGISLSLIGGNPAKGSASEQPLALVISTLGCGTGAKLDASYEVTTISGTTSKAAWLATNNA